MLNKVMLIGNLGDDPEVRHLENGSVVARFSLATNERYKDKNGDVQTLTEWHDVVAWRGLAKIAEQFLKKGKMVYVEGKVVTRKWQDKDGNPRRTTEILANNFQMLDRRDSGGDRVKSNFPSAQDEPMGKPISGASGQPMNPQKVEAPVSPPTDSTAAEDDLPF